MVGLLTAFSWLYGSQTLSDCEACDVPFRPHWHSKKFPELCAECAYVWQQIKGKESDDGTWDFPATKPANRTTLVALWGGLIPRT